MLGSSFFELPESEVSPGDSWTGEAETEIPVAMGATLRMETDVTYTLVGLDGDLAEISLDGAVTLSGDGAATQLSGTGGVSGTALYHTGLSRLHSHESVLNLDIAGVVPISMQTITTRRLVP